MSNSHLNNEYGNLITVCPYCKTQNILQFPVVDIFIYLGESDITLKKTIGKTPETDQYIRTILKNSLKKKPFMGRIILTKSNPEIIKKLIEKGLLEKKDIEKINNTY